MQNLPRLAAWIDQHARPQPSEILSDRIRVYSDVLNADGKREIVADEVRTYVEARGLLGY